MLEPIPEDRLSSVLHNLRMKGDLVGVSEGGRSYRVGVHLISYLSDDQYQDQPWHWIQGFYLDEQA